MTWLRILLSFVFGITVFASLQNFFHLNALASVAIAVAATLVTWIERAVALADKTLDIRKKWLEVQKLQREEEESGRQVKLATPDEVKEHGGLYFERDLRARHQSKTRDTVKPTQFISDSHEDDL